MIIIFSHSLSQPTTMQQKAIGVYCVSKRLNEASEKWNSRLCKRNRMHSSYSFHFFHTIFLIGNGRRVFPEKPMDGVRWRCLMSQYWEIISAIVRNDNGCVGFVIQGNWFVYLSDVEGEDDDDNDEEEWDTDNDRQNEKEKRSLLNFCLLKLL